MLQPDNSRYLPVIIFFTIVISVVFLSCKDESKSSVNFDYDPEVIPSMLTHNDTMQISDSGIIRYKVIAKTWEIFDRAKDPHWRYPNGFYLEQFDSLRNIIAVIKADTVWNYTSRKLWKLRGNVFIYNRNDETFKSDELYWDERQQKVYSNTFVEVNRPNQMILRGRGFEANEQMTNYKFRDVGRTRDGTTLLYVNEESENNAEKEE